MTKIILSVILLTSFSMMAKAQFTKGSALLGGTLSYSSNKSTYSYTSHETSNNYGNFNIAVGKAIRENAVIGINLNYQPSTYTYPAGSGIFKNTINKIPQMFSAAYSSSKSTTDPGVSSKSDAFSVNLNLNSNPLNSLGLGFRLVL